MDRLCVIPGAVSRTAFRALVLMQGQGAPQVEVQPAAGDQVVVTDCQPLPVSPAMQQELARYNMGLFVVQTVTQLEPGRAYHLTAGNGTMTAGTTFRTLAEEQTELRVVVASCYYDYFHRDRDYLATLQSVWCKGAAFKLLLGDNLYMDVAPDQRQLQGGYHETVWRYVHYFFHSAYTDVLAHFPTFTTWDDHEFWNNYPEEQCHLARSRGADRQEYIEAGQECLRKFQAILNGDLPAGDNLSYPIEHTPGVSFFVADMRTARTRMDAADPSMMPATALQQLEDWAVNLQRPGVLVLGQPLWIDSGNNFDYNPPDFTHQYARLWKALASAPYDILLVSGDVHHSRALVISLPGGRRVYEFITSPACHIPTLGSVITEDRQDRGAVKIPAAIPVQSDQQSALKPRVERYAFGTSVPNTLGVLTFQTLANGHVAVSGTFLDCLQRQPAPAEPLSIGHQTWPAGQAVCHEQNLFLLRQRL